MSQLGWRLHVCPALIFPRESGEIGSPFPYLVELAASLENGGNCAFPRQQIQLKILPLQPAIPCCPHQHSFQNVIYWTQYF